MKKLIIPLLLLIFIQLLPSVVFASEVEGSVNVDDALNEVLEGIDESEFIELTNLLNQLSGENKSLKEWIIEFITGEYTFSFDAIKGYFKGVFNSIINKVALSMSVVLFIGITCSVSNVIISKNADNNAKSIIYYISNILTITVISGLVTSVFLFVKNSILTLNKIIDLVFPVLITLTEFTGGFGATGVKSFTVIVSYLSSNLSLKLFLPALSITTVLIIVGNISDGVKLTSLTRTILSAFKWLLGIITVLLTVAISSQSIVNMQYNGISFKILKYATGSLIPIVGGFVSGGLDVVLSSAVLVKNAFGLLASIFVLFSLGVNGVVVLVISFIMRFTVSIAEPMLDSKFNAMIGGVCEVFNHLSALTFVCSISFILVCLSFISTTALIS